MAVETALPAPPGPRPCPSRPTGPAQVALRSPHRLPAGRGLTGEGEDLGPREVIFTAHHCRSGWRLVSPELGRPDVGTLPVQVLESNQPMKTGRGRVSLCWRSRMVVPFSPGSDPGRGRQLP